MPHAWLQPVADVPKVIDTHELAWAAGFFDGEGSTSLHGSGRRVRQPRLSVPQAEPFTLDRFRRAVFCIGRIGQPRSRPSGSIEYCWHTTRWTEAHAVIALLWRWLGPVKRDQAVRVFRVHRAGLDAYQASSYVCRNGHRKSVPGRCKRCSVQQVLRWRASHREHYLNYMREYDRRRRSRAANVSTRSSRARG